MISASDEQILQHLLEYKSQAKVVVKKDRGVWKFRYKDEKPTEWVRFDPLNDWEECMEYREYLSPEDLQAYLDLIYRAFCRLYGSLGKKKALERVLTMTVRAHAELIYLATGGAH